MANREAAPPLVELRDVRKSFGDNVVLDETDLAIGGGEAVVIAGPSGSGKPTMLRCINGLEEVDSGQVLFAGQPVDPRSKPIGRMRADGMVGLMFIVTNLALSRLSRRLEIRERERSGTKIKPITGLEDQVATAEAR